MVGYIAHLECPGTEGPSSIAGYISGVTFFVTSLGLQSPGLVLPGQLHPAVKMATQGFQRRSKKRSPPPPEPPGMPQGTIERMMGRLSKALAQDRLEDARSLLAPICRFYLIQRPTLVATLVRVPTYA
jgi:hypothetical protein